MRLVLNGGRKGERGIETARRVLLLPSVDLGMRYTVLGVGGRGRSQLLSIDNSAPPINSHKLWPSGPRSGTYRLYYPTRLMGSVVSDRGPIDLSARYRVQIKGRLFADVQTCTSGHRLFVGPIEVYWPDNYIIGPIKPYLLAGNCCMVFCVPVPGYSSIFSEADICIGMYKVKLLSVEHC